MAKPKYHLDTTYFHSIDNEEKAYWAGFCWCDGTVVKRKKGNHVEYCFKLDLQARDINHLYKFKKSLKSNHKIKEYSYTGGYKQGEKTAICRIDIYTKNFSQYMYHNMGIYPHRVFPLEIVEKLPTELIRHFIRGVIDADGSLNKYTETDPKNGNVYKKVSVAITTEVELNNFINDHLISQGLMKNKLAQMHRNEDRNSTCRTLNIGGTIQAPNVLHYIYGNSNVYLDRKYQAYLDIMEYVN